MTRLSMDPLTLTHVLITLVAILAGFVVLGRMYISRVGNGWTGTFLAASILTSITGFVFFHPPHPPTPAQATGAAALVVLAPTLYALYVRHLVGVWRPVYVIGAVISLWLNVFVLIIQIFQKVPALQALAGNPPSGPVFAAVQGIVLVAFIVAGWGGVKHFHPIGA